MADGVRKADGYGISDGGKPFNPLLAGKMADPNIGREGCEHLGLRLVNNIVENISYKYMYGLNIVLIKMVTT